jgi:outer membrane lipoprotein-sorting protein
MFPNALKTRSLAVLGFSLLALSAACGGTGSGGGGNSSANTNSSSSTPAPSNQAGEQQVVSKTIQAQNDLRDLKATMHSDTSQGGRSFTTDGTVQWTASPERFYAKTTSSMSDRPTEVIIDTPTQSTYVNAGASWIKTPVGGGTAQTGGFMPTLKGDAFKGFKVVGKENVQGKPTWHLSGPLPYTAGSSTNATVQNATGTLDVWVGQDDYRLVKQVEDLKSSSTGGLSMQASVFIDSVNSGLTIPLPNAA